MHRSDQTSDRTGLLHHVRRLLVMDGIDLAAETRSDQLTTAPRRVGIVLDLAWIVSTMRGGGGVDRRPLLMRPVSIPDDIEDRSLPKASGRVTLPRHIAWSFPYSYDLDNRKSLRACYARVMTEGLDDDVRFYIDLDVLLDIWDEMWLSPHVREA